MEKQRYLYRHMKCYSNYARRALLEERAEHHARDALSREPFEHDGVCSYPRDWSHAK